MTAPPAGTPRERMVDSAAALLAAHGAQATGMRDVAIRAGAPRGSLQHYFPGGKAQLVDEAVARAAAYAAGGAARYRDEGATAVEQLQRTAARWRRRLVDSDYTAGCPLAAVTTDGSAAAPGPAGAAVAGSVRAAFDSWIGPTAQILERDGFAPARAQALARVVVSAIEGALVLCRAARSTDALDAVAAELPALLSRS